MLPPAAARLLALAGFFNLGVETQTQLVIPPST
jgi:hypothetical protein